MASHEYDAVVVGSGPNGLAAGIVLQKAGLSVLLVEGKETIGGGMRTAELTEAGFLHDVCSAIHPLGADSPFFRQLPLNEHGLEWLRPPLALAHPFDDGSAAVMKLSLEETARGLGHDCHSYKKVFGRLVEDWPRLEESVLAPLKIPRHPWALVRFGLQALRSGRAFAEAKFQTRDARGLFAGLAAHSILPLEKPATAAFGLVLGTLAHINGWPMPRGGSQKIADALGSYFTSLGGRIETGRMIRSLKELPAAKAILLDITPRQVLALCGGELSSFYRSQLRRFRYGPGVFKIDWALHEPPPFRAEECRRAGTVHLGGSFEEIAASERSIVTSEPTERPFVLLAQQSVTDPSRAPAGKHVAWGYCHVPHGSTADMTEAIENQVERFAPGFKETIIARHTMNVSQMESYNPNYIGGDINGGAASLDQIFTRPALRAIPYATSSKHVFLCSSSTPPGGGVHGMCGYHAARVALKRVFGLATPEFKTT